MKIQEQKEQEAIKQMNIQQQIISIRIKNINKSIQDLTLQVPITWSFGQLMMIIGSNHPQLKNYQLHCMKFIVAGSYVEEEDRISKHLKQNQSEITVFLKLDVSGSNNKMEELYQSKLNLNTKYCVNQLWENYVEKLVPFSYENQKPIQEYSIQNQRTQLEIISSAFPILHPQTENLLSDQNNTKNKTEPQRAQLNQQDQIDQELADDNFYVKNIPIMFIIYYFVISKFNGPIYYALLFILMTYFFIKYKDHKHKKQQNQQPNQPNQQPQQQQQQQQQQPQQQQNQQNNNNNNGENNNINKDGIDSIVDNNIQNKNNETLNKDITIKTTDENEQSLGQKDSDNQANEQTQNLINSLKKEQNQTNNTTQKNDSQEKNKKKKKKKVGGIVMLYHRIHEFVHCFVMSLFPLWYVDLYNREHPHPNENLDDDEDQKQEQKQNQQSANDNKTAAQQNNNVNNAMNLNNQQELRYLPQQQQQQQQQGLNGGEQQQEEEEEQKEQKGGLLDRLENYLENKIKQYQEEEIQLRRQLNQLNNQVDNLETEIVVDAQILVEEQDVIQNTNDQNEENYINDKKND